MLTQEDLTVDCRDLDRNIDKIVAQARPMMDEQGCFIARGMLSVRDIASIQNEVRELIALRMKACGLKPKSSMRFDDGIMELVQKDRQEGAYIYNACRQLLSIHALDVRPALVELSKKLIGSDFLSMSNVKMLRMDLPGEEKFLYPWHQDFPYVQDSDDALVYWFPIHDLVGNNGGLTCALGSHRQGVYPVVAPDAENKNRNRGLSIALADPETPYRFPQFHLTKMAMGDVLVFNTLLLHTSVANDSDRPRWTIQLRHGNYRNERIVKKGWPGGNSLTSSFVTTHPEYVKK